MGLDGLGCDRKVGLDGQVLNRIINLDLGKLNQSQKLSKSLKLFKKPDKCIQFSFFPFPGPVS